MRHRTTNKVLLLKKLRREKVISSSELEPFISQNIALKRLAEAGEILNLGSGYYGSIDLDPFIASVIAVSKYFPDTVISNLTALSIYGLSDEVVNKIDVDVERNKSIRNRLLTAHRIPAYRLIGITKLDFHGKKIRIYDIERSLIESYLLDPGGGLFYKALKRYLKLKKPAIDRIQIYDKKLKTKVLSHLMQELADG